jgi:hypothetical protein
LVGCSSPASSSDSSGEAVETGSRWRSGLADGFYDGTDADGHNAIVRLWSSGTTQYFDFAAPAEEHTGCTGAVDVAVGGDVSFVGQDGTCRYALSKTPDKISLREYAGSTFTLVQRADGALSGTFVSKAGTTLVVSEYATGIAIDIQGADGTEIFQGRLPWAAPTSWDMGGSLAPAYMAPFSAPFILDWACHAALYADFFQGHYSFYLWSADDTDGHCMPDDVGGLYEPK